MITKQVNDDSVSSKNLKKKKVDPIAIIKDLLSRARNQLPIPPPNCGEFKSVICYRDKKSEYKPPDTDIQFENGFHVLINTAQGGKVPPTWANRIRTIIIKDAKKETPKKGKEIKWRQNGQSIEIGAYQGRYMTPGGGDATYCATKRSTLWTLETRMEGEKNLKKDRTYRVLHVYNKGDKAKTFKHGNYSSSPTLVTDSSPIQGPTTPTAFSSQQYHVNGLGSDNHAPSPSFTNIPGSVSGIQGPSYHHHHHHGNHHNGYHHQYALGTGNHFPRTLFANVNANVNNISPVPGPNAVLLPTPPPTPPHQNAYNVDTGGYVPTPVSESIPNQSLNFDITENFFEDVYEKYKSDISMGRMNHES